MSGLASRFGNTRFGVGDLSSPFQGVKSFLSYRQVSWVFATNLLSGIAILLAVICIMILETVSLAEGKVDLRMNVYPDDSQTYALFALIIPLMGTGAVALVAAFGGRVIFKDSWLQIIYFGVVTALNLLGWGFGIFGMVVICGRIHNCRTVDKGSTPCDTEWADLLATLILYIWLIIWPLFVWIMAGLGLFVRNIQYMAIGMKNDDTQRGAPFDRTTMSTIKNAGQQKKAIYEWNAWKSAKEGEFAGVTQYTAVSTMNQFVSNTQSNVSPSAAHHHVASILLNRK